MLREIRELGFEYVELSHGTRISLLPGILEALDAGEMKVSSLHNFCPLPLGVDRAAPNLYQFSAERPRERELAQRYTVKTFEFAVRVKAPVVVLHLGSIEMKDYTGKLLALSAAGQKETAKYRKLCAEMDAKREAKKGPFLERMKATLKKLLPGSGIARASSWAWRTARASKNCRSKAISLSSSANWPARAWSIGMTPAMPRSRKISGSCRTRSSWNLLRDRLCGFHVHDVQFPGRDHCAPGTGTIDFAALKPLVKPQHLKVFEFSPGLKPDEARGGVEHVKRIWGLE